MGKYEALEKDVFSIFGSAEWKAEKVLTEPANFVSTTTGSEFIRVNVLPSGKGINRISASGVLIIDIFTPAGSGPKRAALIADKLDKHLVAKTIQLGEGSTQFGDSSFTPIGKDKADSTRFLSSYTISFNYFGVL